VPHLTEYGAADGRLHKNTSQPERKNFMPSRGSPIVQHPSKPNVEEANGITADAEPKPKPKPKQARATDAPADRKPNRATLGFSWGATQTGVHS
jgi:hypothetical protein